MHWRCGAKNFVYPPTRTRRAALGSRLDAAGFFSTKTDWQSAPLFFKTTTAHLEGMRLRFFAAEEGWGAWATGSTTR